MLPNLGARIFTSMSALVLIATVGQPWNAGASSNADPVNYVPVEAIGCTGTNDCIAVGSGSPTTVAWSVSGRPWTVTQAPSLRVDGNTPLSISCSQADCLLAGSNRGHLITWYVDPRRHSIVKSAWRLAGNEVTSVNCSMSGKCELLSYAYNPINSIGYFAETPDTGRHWTIQRRIASEEGWAWTGSITLMSCPSLTTCLVVGGSGGTINSLGIARTRNAGRSWSATINRTYQQATSLACVSDKTCYAMEQMANSNPPFRLLGTSNFGLTWYRLGAPKSGYTGVVGCTTTGLCTTGAAAPNRKGWFSPRRPTYFADQKIVSEGVACGSRWCASAIGSRLSLFSIPG